MLLRYLFCREDIIEGEGGGEGAEDAQRGEDQVPQDDGAQQDDEGIQKKERPRPFEAGDEFAKGQRGDVDAARGAAAQKGHGAPYPDEQTAEKGGDKRRKGGERELGEQGDP